MQRKRIEILLITLLSLTGLAVLLLRLFFAFSYIPETGGVSINVIYGIIHLQNTGILYINPENAPFSIIQYMPFYYYLINGIASLLNLSGDVHQMMTLHRILCLLFDVSTASVLFTGIRKIFPLSGIRLALICGLFYFTIIPSINFGRIDTLYLLSSITVILIALKYFVKSSTIEFRNLVIAGIISTVALLTKQTGMLLIVFISSYLLFFHKSPKSTFIYLLSAFIPAILFILLILPSPAIDFKLNVVNGLKNGINLNWFFEVFVKNYYLKYSILLASGLYFSGILISKDKSGKGFYIAYGILFYFFTAVFLSLKMGSGPNYYLEFIMFTLLAVAYFLNQEVSTYDQYFKFSLFIIPFILLSSMNDKGWSYLGYSGKSKKDYQNCNEVSTYIKKHIAPGEYLLTAFHKENCLNLLLADYALFPCREVALYQTYPQGVFTFAGFKKLLDAGHVKYYIDYNDVSPDKFLNESLSSFVPDTIIGAYTVYRTQK
jgi:hypothetical protein